MRFICKQIVPSTAVSRFSGIEAADHTPRRPPQKRSPTPGGHSDTPAAHARRRSLHRGPPPSRQQCTHLSEPPPSMAGRRATGGPAAAPALALACSLAWLARASCDLAAETAGKCAFMETAFVETFSGPTLNSTRWVQASLNGLFHCNKGTERFVRGPTPAAPRAPHSLTLSPPQCTMASSSNFQTNQSLPFYPFGDATGAVLTLTQARPLQAAPLPLPCSPSRPSAASLTNRTRATTHSTATCAARSMRARWCAPTGRGRTPSARVRSLLAPSCRTGPAADQVRVPGRLHLVRRPHRRDGPEDAARQPG